MVEEVESNVTGRDTDSLLGSYSRPLATREKEGREWEVRKSEVMVFVCTQREGKELELVP
jgi:hypothetical protein